MRLSWKAYLCPLGELCRGWRMEAARPEGLRRAAAGRAILDRSFLLDIRLLQLDAPTGGAWVF